MPRLVAALLAALVLVAAAVARGEDAVTEEAVPVTPQLVKDASAKKLVASFDAAVKAVRKEEVAVDRKRAQIAALRELAASRGARIAKRLVEAAADADLETDARLFALKALPLQAEEGRTEVKRLARWLAEESEQDADDQKRGRIGVPVDRAGDPVTDTPEAQRALRAGAERARVLAAGLVALRELQHVPKDAAALLAPFLQSPYDELAVAAVATAQAWEARDVAPDLALLLRMYPRDNRWETGAVTHIGGTNASAKSAWMTLFGHPLKQRARPEVYRAVVACVSAWAGTTVADPESCDAWLATLKR